MAAVAVAVAVPVVDTVAVVNVGDDSPSSKHGADAEVVQSTEEKVLTVVLVLAKTAKIHSHPAPHPPSQRISSVSPSKA